jgi:hypothetical protein
MSIILALYSENYKDMIDDAGRFSDLVSTRYLHFFTETGPEN